LILAANGPIQNIVAVDGRYNWNKGVWHLDAA